jgi:hypothetical protein
MDLDWCTEADLKNTSNFNENLVIGSVQQKEEVKEENSSSSELKVENCFNQSLEIKESKDLLNILNYLSTVSNHLRTKISTKINKNDNDLTNTDEYELILKYLNWLKTSASSIKNHFASPIRRDNSYDPNNIKLFKTSSYKFCNFKESCVIHKNKNRSCEKNHYVFDMIINDIEKLIESITILGNDNINWIIKNKYLLVKYNDKNYILEKINENIPIQEQNQYLFVVDKILIIKSFNVISYVLTKMYEESFYFLNFNMQSLLITL